jgi:hypothetical protein
MAKVRSIGNASMRDLKQRIASLPVSLAQEVARDVAPVLSGYVHSSYASGETVYGTSRPGHPRTGRVPSLNPGGRTDRSLGFTSAGTIVRVKLSYPWVKYLIGWFQILPAGGQSPIPPKHRAAIEHTVRDNLNRRAKA